MKRRVILPSFFYNKQLIFFVNIKKKNMPLILKKIEQFENWFNKNFGWFFINGRKTTEKLKA